MTLTMAQFAEWFFNGVRVFCGCVGFIAAFIVVVCVLGVLASVVGLFIRVGGGDE